MQTQALHDGLLPLAFSPWKHTKKLHQIRRERHAGEMWGSTQSFGFAKYHSGLKCLRRKTVSIGTSRQLYRGLGAMRADKSHFCKHTCLTLTLESHSRAKHGTKFQGLSEFFTGAEWEGGITLQILSISTLEAGRNIINDAGAKETW